MTAPTVDSHPSLDALFKPRSIAVVGASPDVAKPGGRVLAFLRRLDYQGTVHPVNGKYEEIAGLTALPTIDALPEGVDLVVLAIAARHVPEALEAAGRRGARSAIVFSSGFREAGAQGAELERELVEAAERHGIALLGPNCLGYVDVEGRVPATFTVALEGHDELTAGPIALVSQSGAMGAAIFGVAQSEGLGLALFASTGNEACLGFAEVLGHVGDDPGLSVLLGYLEGVSDGRKLVGAVRRARAAGKEVAVLKVGTSEAGTRAAASHTGAMAGAAETWDAALRRGGALSARSPRELLDAGVALSCPRRPSGSRIGIVSMSGGAGVMMADRAEELGLDLPQLGAETRERLAAVLPSFAAVSNPVDYGAAYGDPDAVEATLATVASAPEVDAVAFFAGLSPRLAGVIEPRIADAAERAGKPIVVAWLGGPPAGIRALRALGVPAYDDPIRAVEAVAILRDSARPLPEHQPLPEPDGDLRGILEQARRGGDQLAEREAKRLLAAHGVPVVREALATSAPQARELAAALGGPVAVKAEAPGLLHKSDAGAVLLGVEDDGVERAFQSVVEAAAATGTPAVGAVIAEMAPEGGVELLVGTRWDEQFGPLILVGAGGVTTELADDVRTELAPVDASTAREMLTSLRLGPLLTGFRGAPPCDVAAAAEAIAAISRFAALAGDAIVELDVNPLRVHRAGEGVRALDAAAVLGGPA